MGAPAGWALSHHEVEEGVHMRVKRTVAAIAAGLSVALVAAGCGGSGGSGDQAGGEQAISVYGGEPENPLIPADTNENNGGKVIDALFSQLVQYNTDTGAPELDVAQSIQPNADSTEFTVTIKDGLTFHDGSPVTAESFVKAWNWGANASNAALNASWFDFIEGYEQVHPTDPDGSSGPQEAPAPTAQTMSGLSVQNPTTFTVRTNRPYAQFKTVVGYTTFAPLPESFFADPEAFGQRPVGNGPFRFEDWQHNQSIELARFDQYQGAAKPSIQGVTFQLYQEEGAAYRDVQAGNLDFLYQVPQSALVNRKYTTDFPEHNANTVTMANETVTFPFYLDAYKDVNTRRAISMAIDRETIVDKVFFGAREPASKFVPGKVPGSDKVADCEFCVFAPEKAKQAWAMGSKPATVALYYNSDASHKQWTEAVCGSVTNTLGVACNAVPVPTFAQLRQAINANDMQGMYRSGWLADYPSLDNFLGPNYSSNGSSNEGGYANPMVDAKLAEGSAKTDEAAAAQAWAEGFNIVAQDMPGIPLWNTSRQAVWTDKVSNIKVNVRSGLLDLSQVQVAPEA
ncbi:peptide ABC transporter substrate-binding protein [Pseudonocardia nantongensis]|uniref:peptide ABC transporter substrate-binding protein n=1 Tax=Pseudonocardia nantongensis TaxID=1181885 RepID=UPI00397C4DF5